MELRQCVDVSPHFWWTQGGALRTIQRSTICERFESCLSVSPIMKFAKLQTWLQATKNMFHWALPRQVSVLLLSGPWKQAAVGKWLVTWLKWLKSARNTITIHHKYIVFHPHFGSLRFLANQAWGLGEASQKIMSTPPAYVKSFPRWSFLLLVGRVNATGYLGSLVGAPVHWRPLLESQADHFQVPGTATNIPWSYMLGTRPCILIDSDRWLLKFFACDMEPSKSFHIRTQRQTFGPVNLWLRTPTKVILNGSARGRYGRFLGKFSFGASPWTSNGFAVLVQDGGKYFMTKPSLRVKRRMKSHFCWSYACNSSLELAIRVIRKHS